MNKLFITILIYINYIYCSQRIIYYDNWNSNETYSNYSQLNNKLWTRAKLSWSYLNYPKKFLTSNQSRIFDEINQAFKAWQSISYFEFDYKQNDSNADIVIQFLDKYHKLHEYDTGFPEGVVGHAAHPEFGYIHLSNDHTFRLSFEKDYLNAIEPSLNLFYIMLHELGHALGMNHLGDIQAVMFPAYIEQKPDAYQFKFGDSDISQMYRLYRNVKFIDKFHKIEDTIPKSEDNNYPNFNPCKKTPVNWCENDLKFDKIFHIDEYMFLYQLNNFWLYNDDKGILSKKFHHDDYWDVMNDNLISIMKIDGKLHAFYRDYIEPIDNCYLKSLSFHYSQGNISEKIDTVYYNETKDTLYLFTKESPKIYYRVDNVRTKPKMMQKPISLFKINNYDYDYAFNKNNNLYFVKNDLIDYYDFDIGVVVSGIEFRDLFLRDHCQITPIENSYKNLTIKGFDPQSI